MKSLRLLFLLLLLFLAVKPSMIRPDPGAPTRWAVLVDNSGSMRVQDPKRRIDRVKEQAAQILRKFSGSEAYRFSNDTTPLPKDEIAKLKTDDTKTDLAGAIRTAFRDKKYKGAVILTDGQPVGSADPVSEAASQGRPLVLVGVGNGASFKDVAVRAIQSPPFSFKNTATSLSATISVIGYAGRDIVIKLKEGERVLGQQTIKAANENAETSVSFTWTPTSVGTKILTVEAGTYEGEITTRNNRKDVALDVGREKFRVLYLCGIPGPEYGFLRHQLKSDPAVELVTFVILRNSGNAVNVPDNELSLIPFPTQDILVNQLSTFDLIIFEEFAYQQYGLSPSLLMAIRQKVNDGGSFLLMGGQAAFGAGSPYAIDGFRDILPVEIGRTDVRPFSGPVKFIPTSYTHPVVRLDSSVEQNQALWKSLAPLDDSTFIPQVKPGATVLARGKMGDVDAPLLTVWRVGKGRVAALATRTTWRWAMGGGKNGQGPQAYQQFWKNLVLWCARGDELKMVRLAFEDNPVKVGEENRLRVWVYDEYFQPLSDAEVKIQMSYPDGTKKSLSALPENAGVYSVSIKPDVTGFHTLEAYATRQGKRLGFDRLKFNVVESHLEDEDLRPNFTLLKEMAKATDGKFVTMDDFTPDVLRDIDNELSPRLGRKVLLWTSPWVLGVALLLIMGEWIYRRRRGLP